MCPSLESTGSVEFPDVPEHVLPSPVTATCDDMICIGGISGHTPVVDFHDNLWDVPSNLDYYLATNVLWISLVSVALAIAFVDLAVCSSSNKFSANLEETKGGWVCEVF
jgi:hypothetical protein